MDLAAAQKSTDVDDGVKDLTENQLVVLGLELEETQCVFLYLFLFVCNPCNRREIIEHLAKKSTLHRETNLQSKRVVLIRGIKKFRKAQERFMPGLQSYLSKIGIASPFDENTVMVTPERIPLHLPSSITYSTRLKYGIYHDNLVNVEDKLREAQAHESLEELRTQLRARVFAASFTDKNLSGQYAYTRSQSWRDGIESRIKTAKASYLAAHSSLRSLRNPEDLQWQNVLQHLRPEDVRGIGQRTLSNIEKDDYRKDQQRQGLLEKDVDLTLATEPPMVLFDPAHSSNRLNQITSWIWHSTAERELEGGKNGLVASAYRVL